MLLGPELGFVHGIGGMYTATLNQPPSPTQRLEFAFEVATFGGATVLIEAVTDETPSPRPPTKLRALPYFSLVDELVETLEWPQT